MKTVILLILLSSCSNPDHETINDTDRSELNDLLQTLEE